MATKKPSRKKKKSTSRRNITLLIIATVLGALIVWASVNAARQQQLEREDREKFTMLEMKMQEVNEGFVEVLPGILWNQDKSCDRMNTPFPTDEGMGCSIEINTTDGVQVDLADQLRNKLTALGFKEGSSTTSSEEENLIITDYDPQLKDVYCSLLLPGADNNGMIMKPAFYCRSSSEKLIYPEQ